MLFWLCSLEHYKSHESLRLSQIYIKLHEVIFPPGFCQQFQEKGTLETVDFYLLTALMAPSGFLSLNRFDGAKCEKKTLVSPTKRLWDDNPLFAGLQSDTLRQHFRANQCGPLQRGESIKSQATCNGAKSSAGKSKQREIKALSNWRRKL